MIGLEKKGNVLLSSHHIKDTYLAQFMLTFLIWLRYWLSGFFILRSVFFPFLYYKYSLGESHCRQLTFKEWYLSSTYSWWSVYPNWLQFLFMGDLSLLHIYLSNYLFILVYTPICLFCALCYNPALFLFVALMFLALAIGCSSSYLLFLFSHSAMDFFFSFFLALTLPTLIPESDIFLGNLSFF